MSFKAFITFLWDKKHQKNNPMQAIDQSMNVSMNEWMNEWINQSII